MGRVVDIIRLRVLSIAVVQDQKMLAAVGQLLVAAVAVLAAEAWKIFLICSSAGRAAARVVLMPVLSAVLIYALTWKSLLKKLRLVENVRSVYIVTNNVRIVMGMVRNLVLKLKLALNVTEVARSVLLKTLCSDR